MNNQYTRAPHRRGAPTEDTAPNAALLIDFDNVTMGIRSNLGQELRNLLNSDIIRGKVAVQRAYADWRRYPQYIVPLSEASIDLIFAPAYGSSKKNATDIRLAIDALEIVFTRPEIGTYILMSGDSDFSSLVLKLKEYGKYVIGVGLQESSSDILVQNCDEYYSYTSLSGLTAAADMKTERYDPWELVERAVARMVERKDVMRSDRLKQVMLELDSGFDEKTLGFSKFNRFLAEAASRDILRLRKAANGQYEVTPLRERRASEAEEGGRPRVSSSGRAERRQREVAESRSGRESGRESGGRGRRGGRGRNAGRRQEAPEAPAATETPAAAEAPAAVEAAERDGRAPEEWAAANGGEVRAAALRRAYGLLARVVGMLAGDREGVRDSEVKRKMLAEDEAFDETALGFRKFSRFLQQAHDEGVVDLVQGEDGNYYLSASGEEGPAGAPAGRSESPRAGEPESRAGRRAEEEEAEDHEGRTGEREPAASRSEPAAEGGDAAGRRRTSGGLGRFRRGSRGRGAETPATAVPIGPVDASGDDAGGDGEAPPAGDAPEREAAAGPEREAESSRGGRRGGLGRFRRGSRGGAAAPAAEAGDGSEDAGEPGAGAEAPGPVEAPPGADAPSNGGGGQAGGQAVEHMVRNYPGVGQRTAERLVEEFGPRVFEVIDENPDRVSQILPEARARAVIEAREAERAGAEEEPGA